MGNTQFILLMVLSQLAAVSISLGLRAWWSGRNFGRPREYATGIDADTALNQDTVDAVAVGGWSRAKADILLPRFDILATRILEEKAIIEGKAKFLLAITGAAITLCLGQLSASGLAMPWQVFFVAQCATLVAIGMLLVHRCFLPAAYDSLGDEPKDILSPGITSQPEEWIMLGLAARLQQRITDNRARNSRKAAWLHRLAIALALSPAFSALCLAVAIYPGPR